MVKQLLILIPLGILSGFLSGKSFENMSIFTGGTERIFYAPGLIFGLFFSGYMFVILKKSSLPHFLAMTLWSTASYFIAVMSLQSNDILPGGQSRVTVSIIIAGIIGACLVSTGAYVLYKETSKIQIIVTTVLGGVSALIWSLVMNSKINPFYDPMQSSDIIFFYLFIIWQGSIMPSLGLKLKTTQRVRAPAVRG